MRDIAANFDVFKVSATCPSQTVSGKQELFGGLSLEVGIKWLCDLYDVFFVNFGRPALCKPGNFGGVAGFGFGLANVFVIVLVDRGSSSAHSDKLLIK